MKIVIAYLLLASLLPAKDRDWQEGKLANLERRSIERTERIAFDPGGAIRTNEEVYYQYTVQASGRFWTGEKAAGVKYGGFAGDIPRDPARMSRSMVRFDSSSTRTVRICTSSIHK